MTLLRWLITTCLIMLLSACIAPIVKPGEPVKIKDLTVSSPIAWNQFGGGRERFWTLDGPMLNDFRIFVDVKPGEHIFLAPKGRMERRGEGLLFRKDMNALEVQELFVDALQRYGALKVEASNLRPAKFGVRQGFRFELAFSAGSGVSIGNKSGLNYRAAVLAEVEDGTLSYCYFDAPAEYYFPRDISSVEQVFNSIKLTK
jgi:hypothetical protein